MPRFLEHCREQVTHEILKLIGFLILAAPLC